MGERLEAFGYSSVASNQTLETPNKSAQVNEEVEKEKRRKKREKSKLKLSSDMIESYAETIMPSEKHPTQISERIISYSDTEIDQSTSTSPQSEPKDNPPSQKKISLTHEEQLALYSDTNTINPSWILTPKDETPSLPRIEDTSNQSGDDFIQSENSKFEIEFNEIKIKEKLGEGAFGAVYKGELWGGEVAVKQFVNLPSESIGDFFHEIAVLKTLRHTNCILLLCYSQKPFSIVFECLNQGSLYDLLHNESFRLTHTQIMRVALGTAQGINYLHSKGLLHKDIKSQNVLIGDNFAKIKVSDFGLSKFNAAQGLSKYVGSAQWRAPEASSTYYTDKSDVYSYGVMLWECLTRQIPFYGMGPTEVLTAVRNNVRPPVPKYCPPKFKSIIEQCWQSDPEARPTFSSIIEQLTHEDMIGSTVVGEDHTPNSNLLEREGQSLHFILPKYLNLTQSTPRYARVYSSIFQDGCNEKAIHFFRHSVFGRRDRWWDGSLFLYSEFGTFFNIFTFDSIDNLKKGDGQLVRNRPIFLRINELCSVPYCRQLLEMVALEVEEGAQAALVERFDIPLGKTEDLLYVYKRDVIPQLRTVKGWKGSVVFTDFNTARVLIIKLFADDTFIVNFKKTGVFMKVTSVLKKYFLRTPSYESFTIDQALIAGTCVQSSGVPDQEPWYIQEGVTLDEVVET